MRLEMDAPVGESVELLLFRSVKNASEIRKLVIAGDLSVAALNANLVLHVFPVRCAAQQALLKLKSNTLVSRAVTTEVIFNIAAHRNVGKALTQFGVSDNCEAVLVVVFENSKTSPDAVRSAVDGEEIVNVEESLRQNADIPAIRKLYDISDVEIANGDIVDSIATRIAVSHIK